MTKVNVIIDFYKWNKKISEPRNYVKKKLRKINRKYKWGLIEDLILATTQLKKI